MKIIRKVIVMALILTMVLPVGSAFAANVPMYGFDIHYEFEDGVILSYRGNTENLVIPERINGEKVLEIADEAFISGDLKKVTIPNTVTKLGKNAFAGNKLRTIKIPKALSGLNMKYVFIGNPIQTIIFNNEDLSIESYRMYPQDYFMKDTPKELLKPTYEVEDGIITNYNGYEKNIEIPSVIDGIKITGIGSYAFKNSNLISVIIPDSVTSIGDGAFSHNNLLEVYMPFNLKYNPYSIFKNNPYDLLVKYPNGVDVRF